MYLDIFMTLKQRSAKKFKVDINFNFFLFYFVSLHKGLYMITYTSGPRASSLGDFFRQRLCAEFPLTLSTLLIGLSRTLLRSSLNVSFFCPSTSSLHLSLFVSLPHVSYFLTISSVSYVVF